MNINQRLGLLRKQRGELLSLGSGVDLNGVCFLNYAVGCMSSALELSTAP